MQHDPVIAVLSGPKKFSHLTIPVLAIMPTMGYCNGLSLLSLRVDMVMIGKKPLDTVEISMHKLQMTKADMLTHTLQTLMLLLDSY